MNVSTISIPLQNDILAQVDQIANDEARTRADLISDAVRIYVERKKEWQKIFKIGEKIGAGLEISEDDIMKEIKAYRKEKTE
ncbi:MAG: ribbon-helix-helix domain-containing protein [Treponema sp.]|jgi:predicted transcriptional regulator|nr:ribbon-helix-helix domain-containing protein [Treponema sp.]